MARVTSIAVRAMALGAKAPKGVWSVLTVIGAL